MGSWYINNKVMIHCQLRNSAFITHGHIGKQEHHMSESVWKEKNCLYYYGWKNLHPRHHDSGVRSPDMEDSKAIKLRESNPKMNMCTHSDTHSHCNVSGGLACSVYAVCLCCGFVCYLSGNAETAPGERSIFTSVNGNNISRRCCAGHS